MELSAFQAAIRIRRVQLLCQRNGLDGVLLVPGVDGRFSVCNQAVGYLLDGRSNRDTLDVVKLDGQLDDAIVLVTPTEVRLYAPDADLLQRLQSLLLPHVTSFRILAPTAAEAMDSDLLEENKLGSFVHMLRGCRRMGIPCSLAGPPSGPLTGPGAALAAAAPPAAPLVAEQLMALERWPLLQAYGLEGVGRSGFFTMNFQVFDVQPCMQHLYGDLDGRSLAVLLSEAVPTLRQHWDEMVQALGGKPAGQRGGLSERQVVEPLAGYFAYGLLRAAPGVEQAVTMPPRVIFGPRTSDDAARSEAVPLARCGGGTLKPPSAAALAAGDGEGVTPAAPPPLHMVVEGADPRSPLRVSRTYFLSRGAVTPDVFTDPDEEADEGFDRAAALAAAGWQAAAADAVLLMRLYTALVEAARAAMRHFATASGATALSAKAEALQVLTRRAEQLGVGPGPAAAGASPASPLASRLRFSLLQMDTANRVTAPAVRGRRQLKVLRLALPDINSRSQPVRPLGGLVYGDTFLELPPAAAAGGEAGMGGGGWRLLVLTEGVPALMAIPAGGCEEELAGRALRGLARVVEGAAGAPGRLRSAGLATRRDLERRTAAAAAESQALAARLRARRLLGGGDLRPAEEGEEGEVELEELAEDGARAEAAAAQAAAAAAAVAPRPWEALGRLLTLGGGDDAVLLTGAPSCPSLYGTLYCFSAGLVFVEGASRALWVLDLRGEGGGRRGEEAAGAAAVEAVTMQQLPLAGAGAAQQRPAGTGTAAAISASEGPAAPAAEQSAAAAASGLGEAVVFRGCSPACGLAPACHLTTNTHVALPLQAMSPAARRFFIQSVLPAWQQTCREAAAAATEPRPPSAAFSQPASYLKDMSAPNPFPAALRLPHAYAIQSSSAGGAAKSWPSVMAEDGAVRAAIRALDAAELEGPLSGLDPHIESLLLQPPLTPSAAEGSVTLVVGLPGADQAAVAAAVAAMLGREGGPAVALLPPDEGPLEGAHFAAALEAAAAARHLVIATSSYSSLAEQLRMLAAAAVGGAAGRWRLGAVVVCVSADCLAEEPARGLLAAGAAGQLLAGCVDCVVVGGADAAKVSALSQLVSARLPEVPLVRSGRTALMRARQELLPNPADRADRLAAPQAVAARRWGPLPPQGPATADDSRRRVGAGGCCGGVLGPLRATRVVFEGALDVAKLRDALAALGAPQDPTHVPALPLAEDSETAGEGSLLCVSGCVRLPGPAGGGGGGGPVGQPSELVATRQTALRAREWPLGEAAVVLGAPVLPADGQFPGGDLTFIGSGAAVEAQRLRRLLAGCGAAVITGVAPAAATVAAGEAAADAAVPASAALLSAAQRSEVRQRHLFDPLPEGYCFNGTQYFDAFGDASLEHPHIDRFIAEWVAEQQAKVQAARAQTAAGAGAPEVVRVAGPTRL